MSENAAATTQPNTEGADKPIMIPKARFDEVNNAKKSLEERLASITAKEEAARQEQLKAAGQFGELEKELKAKLEAAEAEKSRLAAIAEKFEAQQKATREATIAQLPEAQREYAASLPPDKLPGFVAAIGGAKPAPPRPGEPGVTPSGKLTPEEIKANAKNPKWLAENFHRM